MKPLRRLKWFGLLLSVVLLAATALEWRTVQGAGDLPGRAPGIIPAVWPEDARFDRLADIGHGKAVVYSPDFSVSGNKQFYQKIGFAYFEDTSWESVISQIRAHNIWHPEDQVDTVIIETHGTNGNGLKLQAGPFPKAARSYISIGALQEKLQGSGVSVVVLAACNAGRLLRPEIYNWLDPNTHDALFLPPTRGILNASQDFDPANSDVMVVRRAESHIETTNDGDTTELSLAARAILFGEPEPNKGPPSTQALAPRILNFAVSDMLVQLLTHDPRLHLTATGFDATASRADYSDDESEEIFQRFVEYIDGVAAREYQIAHGGDPGAIPAPQAASVTPQIASARPRSAAAADLLRARRSARTATRSLRRAID